MMEWDASKLGGSLKKKIMNPDLQEERRKSGLDVDELVRFIKGDEIYAKDKEALTIFRKYPELRS